MSAPRICINLEKIQRNAQVLVHRMNGVGISVTGVAKAAVGYKPIAQAMRRGGVWGIGDSRLANMRPAQYSPDSNDTSVADLNDIAGEVATNGCDGPLWLLRTPMPSEVGAAVALADISSNSELDVIAALSAAAYRQGRVHGVVLMVELGDLREGIMPGQLQHFIRQMLRLPCIELTGIATNLACLSGVIPDSRNMSEFSRIACATERDHGFTLQVVSGGNSANLNWARGLKSPDERGKINNLRLGEAILLGTEAIDRQAIPGLSTDAFLLVGEVIESKRKPVLPTGDIGQVAVAGLASQAVHDSSVDGPEESGGMRNQAIIALGAQDTDPQGLVPPDGIRLLGASSDHIVVDTGCNQLKVGSELAFALNYSALMRAMTSPFVAREILGSTIQPLPELHCH